MPTVSRQRSRLQIGRAVRELRQGRRWTQAELARQLKLSQARLSEIERGGGSFTAEQFLQILRLFNVPASHFDPSLIRDPHAELQNVLARHGASHLRESERVLPSDAARGLHSAIRQALVLATPRLLTALAPVIVNNVDALHLRALYHELKLDGLERRLGWLVENVRDALRDQVPHVAGTPSSASYRRALAVLEPFLTFVRDEHSFDDGPWDVLDRDIRSVDTVAEVRASASPSATRWRMVTSLATDDFSAALRDARVPD